MVIREDYRTSIDHPFDSSKGSLMVIREGYRTSIAPPFDSFKERLDGYLGSLPNKYSPPL